MYLIFWVWSNYRFAGSYKKIVTERSCVFITQFWLTVPPSITIAVLLVFKHIDETIHSLILSSVYLNPGFQCCYNWQGISAHDGRSSPSMARRKPRCSVFTRSHQLCDAGVEIWPVTFHLPWGWLLRFHKCKIHSKMPVFKLFKCANRVGLQQQIPEWRNCFQTSIFKRLFLWLRSLAPS